MSGTAALALSPAAPLTHDRLIVTENTRIVKLCCFSDGVAEFNSSHMGENRFCQIKNQGMSLLGFLTLYSSKFAVTLSLKSSFIFNLQPFRLHWLNSTQISLFTCVSFSHNWLTNFLCQRGEEEKLGTENLAILMHPPKGIYLCTIA